MSGLPRQSGQARLRRARCESARMMKIPSLRKRSGNAVGAVPSAAARLRRKARPRSCQRRPLLRHRALWMAATEVPALRAQKRRAARKRRHVRLRWTWATMPQARRRAWCRLRMRHRRRRQQVRRAPTRALSRSWTSRARARRRRLRPRRCLAGAPTKIWAGGESASVLSIPAWSQAPPLHRAM